MYEGEQIASHWDRTSEAHSFLNWVCKETAFSTTEQPPLCKQTLLKVCEQIPPSGRVDFRISAGIPAYTTYRSC